MPHSYLIYQIFGKGKIVPEHTPDGRNIVPFNTFKEVQVRPMPKEFGAEPGKRAE